MSPPSIVRGASRLLSEAFCLSVGLKSPILD